MKEIEFKSEIDLDSEVYDIEEIDPQKDLGVGTIEELPEMEAEEQFEVTLKKRREDMRERLAIVFVVGLFLILIIGMVMGYLGDQEKVKNITNLILAISGILTGPLGFIVGYYFRKSEEN